MFFIDSLLMNDVWFTRLNKECLCGALPNGMLLDVLEMAVDQNS